ncbi:hypothetical protein AB6A40_002098 [Gnathostoma spinigerum]|uniref:proline--tRNA ligase n=1 Tax=Gnathostoma spinigerum TaxID=75299 RepID=A0ABD6E5R5_9BILA
MDIYRSVEKQGALVRSLKASYPKSAETKAAVDELLRLKKQYKAKTGREYKAGNPPGIAEPNSDHQERAYELSQVPNALVSSNAAERHRATSEDERLVRDPNLSTPNEQSAGQASARLSDSKDESGGEVTWKECNAHDEPMLILSDIVGSGKDAKLQMHERIEDQGRLVRGLKADDPKGEGTKAAISLLLEMKKEYKNRFGEEYKPCPNSQLTSPLLKKSDNIQLEKSLTELEMKSRIRIQGDLVRKLKAQDPKSKASRKAITDLLELKKLFKDITGREYVPENETVPDGRKKEDKGEKRSQQSGSSTSRQQSSSNAEKIHRPVSDETKKQSRLGLEAKKEENTADWYSQVITKSGMIEYYDVSGCYVLRPWSYAIWEVIKKWFDIRIKKMGVRNCYFPIFVSQAALEREKTHIADFAPEVAWVTRAGKSEISEPIAIRPTSETVMYPSYAKWVQSHRDLPIRLNQWCNIVRWEFKHPTPFLRTREFLWQEGHSAFATEAEAQKEVFDILDLYEQIYVDLLAIPVIKGRKSEKEKFAGGVFTTTCEAYVPVNGRSIQGATSHHLGQNFSRMFDISYDDAQSGARQYAYQNSWGLSTRTIGAIVMIHGDNAGLVLPPRVASIQVIVIPVGMTAQMSGSDKDKLITKVNEVVSMLVEEGIRAEKDSRDNYSPGWKFNHWEVKGVPIRAEIGPKDLAKSQVMLVIRHSGERKAVPIGEIVNTSRQLLDTIHNDMYRKVLESRDQHLMLTTKWCEFKEYLDQKYILLAPFCGAIACEEAIKRDSTRESESDTEPGTAAMGAKTLCIPLNQPKETLPSQCIHPECTVTPTAWTLFGRSY